MNPVWRIFGIETGTMHAKSKHDPLTFPRTNLDVILKPDNWSERLGRMHSGLQSEAVEFRLNLADVVSVVHQNSATGVPPLGMVMNSLSSRKSTWASGGYSPLSPFRMYLSGV